MAVLALGCLMIAIAWLGPLRRRLARLPSSRRVLTHLMQSGTGRFGNCVAWAWIGPHFFAR